MSLIISKTVYIWKKKEVIYKQQLYAVLWSMLHLFDQKYNKQ